MNREFTKKCDVVVIGAGAVGCAIARELTKYRLQVTVVDKNEDVGGEASRANSAIVHTGYDATPGTLESELVVAANPMFEKLVADLDVPFSKTGAILPAITEEQFLQLPAILDKAFKNRVYDVEYKTSRQLLEMEPNLNPSVKGGLFISRENIIDPFLLVVALAENAAENGAQFCLGAPVVGITARQGRICGVQTTKGFIEAEYVVNAAGLHCDEVAAMAGKRDYRVNPRRGQFFILDKSTLCQVRHIVLPIPTKLTKGKLICPTVHGNLLVGPTAEDLSDKCDKSTSSEGLNSIREEVSLLVPGLRLQDTITQYAGLRPNRNPEGLHVETYDDLYGYVDLSGVRSTGLTASVSLGKYVAQTLRRMGLAAEFNPDFVETRLGVPRFHELPPAERAALIAKNPAYGRVICRCETVTEGEIIDALHRPVPPRTLDGIKRRLRVGMGRCQGGFCTPRMVEFLARELSIPVQATRKGSAGSYLVTGNLREGAAGNPPASLETVCHRNPD